MKNNRYDKRRRSLKKARSVERVPVAEKVNDFNKRILASVLAFAIVISCMVVGVNLATRAEDNGPVSSLKPVTMAVRMNGQDDYTTATVPAGSIADNQDSITFSGAIPKDAVYQKTLLVDYESNTETPVARVAKYEGKTYYSLDENDTSGTLLLATQDLILVYAEKYNVNIQKTGEGTYTTSAYEDNGQLYIWGGEDLTIQCNPAQDYHTDRIEYTSAGVDVQRVSPKNNYVKISSKNISGDLTVTIPFSYNSQYTVNDARYMSNSKYYPELKELDNHGGISKSQTTKDTNLSPVEPGQTATFYLFSQANSTNSEKYRLNNLSINGENVNYPTTVGGTETTQLKNGSTVTVTFLSEDNRFSGESNKPRTIYEVSVSDVHEDIEVAYYFKDIYKREIIIKGLEGIDQTAYAAEDTNVALVTRYYTFVHDEIYKNVYTAYYSARGIFTDINWFPSDNLVLYTVKPGYNPYTVTTEMYYDDVKAEGVIRDTEIADTPENVIKVAGSSYEDAGRYNTSHRYWGISDDPEIYNNGTGNYLKREGLSIKRTDLLLTTLRSRPEDWYAVALSQNESNNQQLFLNAEPYEYQIICDLDGGTIAGTDEGYALDGNRLVSPIFTLENGDYYTALPGVSPTKSGHRFMGWQMYDENENPIGGTLYQRHGQFIVNKDTVGYAIGDKKQNEGQQFLFKPLWQEDETADVTTVSVAIYQEVLRRDDPDATYVNKDNGKLYKLVNYREEEQHAAQTTILLDRQVPEPASAYELNEGLSKLETTTVKQGSSAIPPENQLAAYYDFDLVTLNLTKEVYGRPNAKNFQVTAKLTPNEDSVLTLEDVRDLIDDDKVSIEGNSLVFTDLFENGTTHALNNIPNGWSFEVSEATKPTDYTSVIRNGNKSSNDNQPLSGTLSEDTNIIIENSKLNDDKNVETDKWLSKNSDDSYNLNMEAYATGQTIIDEVQNAVPTDYILVLDQSGSMAESDMPNGYTGETKNWTSKEAKGKYYKTPEGDYYPVVYKNKPRGYNYYSISSPKIMALTTYDRVIQGEIFGSKDEETFYENKPGAFSSTYNQEVYYKDSTGAYYRVHTFSEGLALRYHGTLYYTDAYDQQHVLGTYTYIDPVWNPTVTIPLYTNSRLIDDGFLSGYHLETDKDPSYSLYYTDKDGVEHEVPNTSPQDATNKNVYSGTLYTPKANITRRKALENAAKAFTDIIEYQAEEYDVDHKIAVVGFSSVSGADNTEILSRRTDLDTVPESNYNFAMKEFPRGVNFNGDQYGNISQEAYENALLSPADADDRQHLDAAIEGITACGGTEPEYGFNMASEILANRVEKTFTTDAGTTADRNTVVIFFTDGVPGNYSTDDQITKANTVVAAAKPLKDDGTKIFSIGVFNEGDDQPLTYTGDNPGNSAPANYYKHEKVGNTDYFFYRGNDVASAEYTDTIADYMRAVSSEYPNATAFYNKGTTNAESGKAPRGAAAGDDVRYYTKVTDAKGLTAAFDYISEQAGPTVKTASLGASNSVLRDIITEDFDLTDGYEIHVYTADAIYDEEDNLTWAEPQPAPDLNATITENADGTKTLNVTNYDYSAHYVAPDNAANAQKVIVEIVGVKPNKTGGVFASNTGDSGIYKINEDNTDKLIDAFPIPAISRYKYNVIVEEENTEARAGIDFTMTAEDWNDPAPIAKDNDSSVLSFTPSEGSDTQQWKPNSNETGAKNGDYIIFEEILESENNSGVVHNDSIPDNYSIATTVKNPDQSGDYEYTLYIDGQEVDFDTLTDLPKRDADIVIRSTRVMKQVLVRKLTRTVGSEDDYADKTRAFDINVKLLDKDGNETEAATYDDVSFNHDGEATIPLAHNQMKIFNIPNNYQLVVSEEDAEPYVTSYVLNNSGEEIEQAVLETGRIADDTSITVYNTIQAPVITGIGDADSKVNPFIIVAVVVALSGGAWIAYLIKRRQQSAEQ